MRMSDIDFTCTQPNPTSHAFGPFFPEVRRRVHSIGMKIRGLPPANDVWVKLKGRRCSTMKISKITHAQSGEWVSECGERPTKKKKKEVNHRFSTIELDFLRNERGKVVAVSSIVKKAPKSRGKLFLTPRFAYLRSSTQRSSFMWRRRRRSGLKWSRKK